MGTVLDIAIGLAKHDRERLKPSHYDPPDLCPHPKITGLLVSDAGLDRGTRELRQHEELILEGTRNTRYDTAKARPHLRNAIQDPLQWYYHRDLLSPGDSGASKAYYRAGKRLRSDWNRAGYQPQVTVVIRSGGSSGGRAAWTDAQLDAVERLAQALRSLNPVPRLCVVAVCCADQTVAQWAQGRVWPRAEAAIEVLRTGLDALAGWYKHQEGS
jgi:hypothetical protein